MSNTHLKLNYNGSNFILNIGFDTYISQNININKNILEFIMKNLNNNNYFVKNSHVWFHNCNITIKYKLSNYNNIINFEIFESVNSIGFMTFKSTIEKTSSSLQFDELSGIFNKLHF
jgi:hypothetical protein